MWKIGLLEVIQPMSHMANDIIENHDVIEVTTRFVSILYWPDKIKITHENLIDIVRDSEIHQPSRKIITSLLLTGTINIC